MKTIDWNWTICQKIWNHCVSAEFVIRITQGSSSSFILCHSDVRVLLMFFNPIHHKGNYRAVRAAENIIWTQWKVVLHCICRMRIFKLGQLMQRPAPGYKDLVASLLQSRKSRKFKGGLQRLICLFLLSSFAQVILRLNKYELCECQLGSEAIWQ